MLRVRAAMDTGEGTGAGHLPCNRKRRLVEICHFHALVVQVPFAGGSFGEV